VIASASTSNSRALPKREAIPPNQRSWTETAESMGVARRPKRKRLPEEHGITKWSIGAPKGKCSRVHTDAYAGGKVSGKRAKPDVVLARASAPACRFWGSAPICRGPTIPAPALATHVPTCVPGAPPEVFTFMRMPGIPRPQSAHAAVPLLLHQHSQIPTCTSHLLHHLHVPIPVPNHLHNFLITRSLQ
jgi:hypothetical protein